MSIEMTDKRARTASISTGTPAAPQVADGDNVLVQPLTTYLEGSRHVGPHSKPYSVPRHHANELKAQGFAVLVEPKKPSEEPVDPDLVDEEADDDQDETDIETPDDTSRAPDPDQVTASTVPPLPGAEPVRPAAGAVPPAAVSDPPQPVRRGRGRPPGRRG